MQMHIAFGSAPAKTLEEAALVPEVRTAALRWASQQEGNERGVLIGGLALAFYARPRQTMDVDVLVKSVSDVYVPQGFTKSRMHAIFDKATQVEIEIVTPAFVGIPGDVADRVMHTAWDLGAAGNHMRVASLDSMIVLKLYGADSQKRRRQDEADIQSMIEHNPRLDVEGLIRSWSLSEAHAEKLREIQSEAL